MNSGPLSGLRVLEICGWNGVLAGRLLADGGADVVRVAGHDDSIRNAPPFFGETSSSLQDAWYNAGKRVLLSPGQRVIEELVAGADALIDDEGSAATHETVAARAVEQGLVRVTVTPFGLTGPWANYRATDIVANAMSGSASVTGDATTGPLNGYGNQTYHTMGLYAALCAMAGLQSRRRTGRGVHVDLAAHEALATCTEQVLMQWFFPEGGPWRSRVAERLGSLHWSGAYDVYPDRDGNGLMVTASLRPADVLVPWLDETGEADDLGDRERYPTVVELVRDMPHVMDVLKQWVGNHNADELFFEAQRRHQPFGAVWDVFKALGSPQIAARGYLQDVSIAPGQSLPFPGRFFRTSADVRHPQPAEVATTADIHWPERGNPGGRRTFSGGGPLAGIRVLDFTHVLAGPFGTRVLGDLGADVIKVGTAKRGGGANTPAHPYYLSWNRNKRSLSLDMSLESARDIARRLAAECDVVIDNFSAGVLARWGLGHASISKTNPRITTIAMGGMGSTGPWKDFVTFAPTIHALVGLTYMTGLPGHGDIGYGFSLTDHLSGLAAAVAALEGVEYAHRTGRGLDIDISQYELGLGIMAPAYLDHLANGVDPLPAGNAAPFGDMAPHGMYRCAGDDAWIAIACTNDSQWNALCGVLAIDSCQDWDTIEGRHAARNDIDAIVATATKTRDRFTLMDALQAAGVSAGPVMNAEDLLTRDPQLATREFFGSAESERFGTYGLDRFPALFDGARPARYDGPVAAGIDTYDVLTTILGIDDETFASLMAEGALT